MAHKKQIDSPNQVVGTNQPEFLVLCEITQIEETEFSISNQHTKRPRILRRISRRLRLRGTKFVRRPSPRQWRLNTLSRRGQGLHRQSFDRQSISRLQNQVMMLRQQFFIRSVIFPRYIRIFLVRPMIDKSIDRQLLRKLHHSTHVITMKMRDEDIIELLHPSRFRRAAMRLASLFSKPGQPVSIKSD